MVVELFCVAVLGVVRGVASRRASTNDVHEGSVAWCVL